VTLGIREDVAVRSLLGLNATLAFLLELALLAAAVAVGLLLPAPLPVRVAAAVLLPLAVVTVWGVWMAPRSGRRLTARGRLLVQAVLFAVAVLGLAALGQVLWAVVLAALVAVRLGLALRTGQV